MTDKDLWVTFEKTGNVMDYLAYKGISQEEPGKENVGEKIIEPENNNDRDSAVRHAYR